MIIFKGNFERTGKYLGVGTYNHFLIKMKGDYYTPIWSTEKLRGYLNQKLKSSSKKRDFFERVLKGLGELRTRITEVFVVEGDVFDFMRDLITLIIFGFSEDEVKQILKKPYTEINYQIIKSSLEVYFNKKDLISIIKYVTEKNTSDERVKLFNLLTRFYKVKYFPEEDPEYRFIIHGVDYYKNRLVNYSTNIPVSPFCTFLTGNELIHNVIHMCYIRPGEYSFYIFKDGEWIKLFDRIKCKQMNETVLSELVNYNDINSIEGNMMLLHLKMSKEYLTIINGKWDIGMIHILKSIDKLYYVKVRGNDIEVFCARVRPILYKFSHNFKYVKYKMIEQSIVPYNILYM